MLPDKLNVPVCARFNLFILVLFFTVFRMLQEKLNEPVCARFNLILLFFPPSQNVSRTNKGVSVRALESIHFNFPFSVLRMLQEKLNEPVSAPPSPRDALMLDDVSTPTTLALNTSGPLTSSANTSLNLRYN